IPGRCGLRENLCAIIHDVVERSLDRIRGGLRLEQLIDDLDHGELLCPRRRGFQRPDTSRIVTARGHGRLRTQLLATPAAIQPCGGKGCGRAGCVKRIFGNYQSWLVSSAGLSRRPGVSWRRANLNKVAGTSPATTAWRPAPRAIVLLFLRQVVP